MYRYPIHSGRTSGPVPNRNGCDESGFTEGSTRPPLTAKMAAALSRQKMTLTAGPAATVTNCGQGRIGAWA